MRSSIGHLGKSGNSGKRDNWVVRLICSHHYRIVLGLVLAISAAAELLGSVIAVHHGLAAGVLLFGLFRVLVAAACVAEGAARARCGPVGELVRSKWGEFAVGLILFCGSGFQLLQDDTEMLSSISVHHGALAIGFFSALSALAHLTVGAQKLSKSQDGWLTHPATEIAVAMLLIIATIGSLEVTHLASFSLHSTHGLFVFGVGRVIEIVAQQLAIEAESEQHANNA